MDIEVIDSGLAKFQVTATELLEIEGQVLRQGDSNGGLWMRLNINHISGLLRATAELGMREAVVPVYDPDHRLNNNYFLKKLVARLKSLGFEVSIYENQEAGKSYPSSRLRVRW